jgi:hypothetical protein
MKPPNKEIIMKRPLTALFFGVILFSRVCSVYATTVEYSIHQLNPNSWEYMYTVKNDTPLANFSDFVIYFPEVSGSTVFDYSNILITANPDSTNWNIIANEPSAIGLGGYIDALSAIPLAAGASVGGFKVTFDYTGSVAPGSQQFDIFNPSFDLIDTGRTVLAQQESTIPEPSILLLLGMGLSVWLFGKKKDRVNYMCEIRN